MNTLTTEHTEYKDNFASLSHRLHILAIALGHVPPAPMSLVTMRHTLDKVSARIMSVHVSKHNGHNRVRFDRELQALEELYARILHYRNKNTM